MLSFDFICFRLFNPLSDIRLVYNANLSSASSTLLSPRFRSLILSKTSVSIYSRKISLHVYKSEEWLESDRNEEENGDISGVCTDAGSDEDECGLKRFSED